jgi:hypothetical protein
LRKSTVKLMAFFLYFFSCCCVSLRNRDLISWRQKKVRDFSNSSEAIQSAVENMVWELKEAAVIGAGYLGTHIAAELALNNIPVTVYDACKGEKEIMDEIEDVFDECEHLLPEPSDGVSHPSLNHTLVFFITIPSFLSFSSWFFHHFDFICCLTQFRSWQFLRSFLSEFTSFLPNNSTSISVSKINLFASWINHLTCFFFFLFFIFYSLLIDFVLLVEIPQLHFINQYRT